MPDQVGHDVAGNIRRTGRGNVIACLTGNLNEQR